MIMVGLMCLETRETSVGEIGSPFWMSWNTSSGFRGIQSVTILYLLIPLPPFGALGCL